MHQNKLHSFAKYYDQIYLQMKNYGKESEVVQGIIRRFEKKPSKTLLDVGCGTGEHLKYLSKHFRCTGLDLSEDMIKTARLKVPTAQFEVGSMIDFKMPEKFDVITCLFSSIGYVQSFKKLVGTLSNFHDHLADDGIVLVEPWIFKKDARKDIVSIDTYEDETVKLVRMGTSKLTSSRWLVYFHYLVGTGGNIKHVQETHVMILADREDYVKAFKLARFDGVRFIEENEWTRSRGLFVALE